MRSVVQRVSHASVKIDGELYNQISNGLLVFVGIAHDDNEKDLTYIADKITNLRIFEDENERMNHSIIDIGGEALVISQFTLFGDCRKGRRPDFTSSCEPKKANLMYEKLIDELKKRQLVVKTGIFGADMKIELLNDGPVTILLDSTKLF